MHRVRSSVPWTALPEQSCSSSVRSGTYLAGVLLILAMGGCERGPAGMEGLVPAGGRVTLNQQPFADVMVVFDHPGHAAVYGRTDQDGFFEMSYTTSQKGAFVGTNRVYFGSSGPEQRTPERVPKAYQRRTSELTVEVSGATGTYNFDLVSESDESDSELDGILKPL